MKNQIRQTSNYSIFELFDFNRDVSKTEELRKSMEKHGWIDAYPLHVISNGTDKLRIKAGHHRFAVAVDLGIPIKYVLCKDSASIHELEVSSRKWSLSDYLISYVRMGKPDYIEVYNYWQETGIPLAMCIRMNSGLTGTGGGERTAEFKNGHYKIGNQVNAKIVKNLVQHCKQLNIPFATHFQFVSALSKLTFVREFDPVVFMKKMTSYGSLLKRQASVEAYLDAIEFVYNRLNKSGKVHFRYLIDKAMDDQRANRNKKRGRGDSMN